jgi:hypothetical protein
MSLITLFLLKKLCSAGIVRKSWTIKLIRLEGIMKRLLVLLVLVAPPAYGEIYSWTDSREVAHYTNRLDEIPVHYRTRAKSLNYGDDPQQGVSSAPRNDSVQTVKPVEQSPGQYANDNLKRHTRPPRPMGTRLEEQRKQMEEKQDKMGSRARRVKGQQE